MSDHIISLRGVTKRFGTLAAVDDVTIDVPRGRCFAWLGPNGCGKTTMIRMMLGLARPTAGEIEVCGFSVPGETHKALARVGGIVEEPRFYPYLSGRTNLEVWAAHFGDAAAGRIDAALDRVNLGDRGGDAVKKYSLGMRQRLGVARALLNDPELLILDEPTNGLDPAGLAEFRMLIRSFVDEGRTVFVSSHILGEVQKMADDVAIIQNGRVVTFGSVEELITGGRQAIIVRSSDPVAAEAALKELPGVAGARVLVDGSLDVSVGQASDEMLSAVSAALFAAELPVYGLWPAQESLEDRFLSITGPGAGEITGPAATGGDPVGVG